MLVVKIELHSAVTGEVKTIATGKIVNTGQEHPPKATTGWSCEMPLAASGRPGRSKAFHESGCSRGIC